GLRFARRRPSWVKFAPARRRQRACACLLPSRPELESSQTDCVATRALSEAPVARTHRSGASGALAQQPRGWGRRGSRAAWNRLLCFPEIEALSPRETSNPAELALCSVGLDPLVCPVRLAERLPDQVTSVVDRKLFEADVFLADEGVHHDYSALADRHMRS